MSMKWLLNEKWHLISYLRVGSWQSHKSKPSYHNDYSCQRCRWPKPCLYPGSLQSYCFWNRKNNGMKTWLIKFKFIHFHNNYKVFVSLFSLELKFEWPVLFNLRRLVKSVAIKTNTKNKRGFESLKMMIIKLMLHEGINIQTDYMNELLFQLITWATHVVKTLDYYLKRFFFVWCSRDK